MRNRIKGLRVECAARKASSAIIEWYEENPEVLNIKIKESKERQKHIKPMKFNSLQELIKLLPNPLKYIGKKYKINHKEHIITSEEEAKVIINLNIRIY